MIRYLLAAQVEESVVSDQTAQLRLAGPGSSRLMKRLGAAELIRRPMGSHAVFGAHCSSRAGFMTSDGCMACRWRCQTSRIRQCSLVWQVPGSDGLMESLGAAELVGQPEGSHAVFGAGSEPVVISVGSGFSAQGYTVVASESAAAEFWQRCIKQVQHSDVIAELCAAQ